MRNAGRPNGPVVGWLWSVAILVVAGCGGTESRTADAAAPDASGPDAVPTALNQCDPAYLPMNRAMPLSCCLKDNDEWFLSGNESSLGKLVHRRHGNPCTLADGVTGGCDGRNCVYGPCSATIVETFAAPAYVFHPVSDPTACGRQATGYDGVPEAWTGAQEPYGSVAPACPWTDCLAGTRVVQLTVTTTATAATGTVMSSPAGIELNGAGSASAKLQVLDVTVSAAPAGAYARAVFSGDCVATGEFGKPADCRLTLGPDKTVAVSFECEDGYTCAP